MGKEQEINDIKNYIINKINKNVNSKSDFLALNGILDVILHKESDLKYSTLEYLISTFQLITTQHDFQNGELVNRYKK